jgi:hypothetical protein
MEFTKRLVAVAVITLPNPGNEMNIHLLIKDLL